MNSKHTQPRFPIQGTGVFLGQAKARFMSSLPFSIPVYARMAKADGLLRLEGSTLVLEFQIQDRALGLLKSDLKELRLPVSEIERLELKTGWFSRPRLCVQTETMRVSRQIPGSQHGEFELTIDAGHQLAARHLISSIETAKNERRSSQEGPHGLE